MTEIESCPIEKLDKSWRDCYIAVTCGVEDHILTRRGIINRTLCPNGCWVCRRCLPNVCPKMIPENPNPIEGKVTWIEA